MAGLSQTLGRIVSLQEGLGPPSRLILVLGSEIVPLDGVQLFHRCRGYDWNFLDFVETIDSTLPTDT